ncbi:hypothetical protein NUW58_g2933 [Xylaria curta]|uniref:Uncharacterized protein n=1 Tax=Xylaria curta TaxID=42375 RepID=A0ACC1PEV7_9PEZI|nr:hypothetical protein NUW58_g2933 [Xylaria curta]
MPSYVAASSLSAIVYSRRRSSRCYQNSSDPQATAELLASFTSESKKSRGLAFVIQVIESSGLYGPVVCFGVKHHLGQGSQFLVTKQTMGTYDLNGASHTWVAVKQPKFALHHDESLSLGDKSAQKHLNDIYTEVAALTNKVLRNHPNIVRLLSWTFSTVGIHSPISLVMELGDWALNKYLRENKNHADYEEKTQFGYDIANGLDALHNNGFIHGDLKPENILVFQQSHRRVAKIADFGLCVGGTELGNVGICLSGTEGWQAPEVEVGRLLTYTGLIKADNYSFGLLCWSVIVGHGQTPPRTIRMNPQFSIEQEIASEDPRHREALLLLNRILPTLLHCESDERPDHLTALFKAPTEDEDFDDIQIIDYESVEIFDYISRESGSIERPLPSYVKMVELRLPCFSWEIPALSDEFAQGLCSSTPETIENTDPTILFGAFLARTIQVIDFPGNEAQAVQLLIASASRDSNAQGCLPARAVIPAVLEYFDLQPDPHIAHLLQDWLTDAVASGATLAKRYLDPSAGALATEHFQFLGGYNGWYSTVQRTPSTTHSGAFQTELGYSKLHWLAAFGTPAEISEHLKTAVLDDVNDMTDGGETPLYLACSRGSWDIALNLMERGASPSHRCTGFGITCLHWVFCFPEQFQEPFLKRILELGGNIRAIASHPMPFPHYPFILPAGTALHWAVVTSSHSAIRVLLRYGASLATTDLSDPYVFDDRFRVLRAFGGPNQEVYSYSKCSTKGLNPLDYAVVEQDPFIFDLINTTGLEVDINSVDEEGVSLLHRITASHIRHTRRGVRFSFLPFQGPPNRQKTNLKRIISTIKQLGGNIDLLTTPNIRQAQPGENISFVQSMTPLMMAVCGVGPALNPIVVEALLEEMINPNTPNDIGTTALHFARPRRSRGGYDKVIRLLCASGADVNHKQSDGTKPLLTAARRRGIEAMGTLLSYGADFTEREWETNTLNEGASVFSYGFLIHGGEVNQIDAQIAECFEKYVFSHPLVDKQSLITKGDLDGCTLLHLCAETTMIRSLRALLREGADVNALKWDYERIRGQNRTELELHMSRLTPLDVAEECRERTIRNQSRDDMKVSLQEFESRLKRHDLTIEILKDAGGRSGLGEVITKRVPWTRDDGARMWSRYREIRDLCLSENNI